MPAHHANSSSCQILSKDFQACPIIIKYKIVSRRASLCTAPSNMNTAGVIHDRIYIKL